MEISNKSKIDRVAEEKWNILARSSEVLDMPKENFEKLKWLFYKGYLCGQKDAIDNMREVYNNDPCLFDEFFDPEPE